MSRKSKITRRKLAAILRESVYPASKPGPLKVILDVGGTQYYMQRALELVALSLESSPFTGEQCEIAIELKELQKSGSLTAKEKEALEKCAKTITSEEDYLEQAITLLGIAKYNIREAKNNEKLS